ncbi:MAG: PSD1 and planctomycete cytochrome C domain-containing protein [Phycisphaeraceae bacterium]|nr:PSD1 and planctomycete cytochrome C domain-containing protein [Phycisphaeraceae bacterium]
MNLKQFDRLMAGRRLLAPLAGLLVLGLAFVLLLSPAYAEPGAGVDPDVPAAPQDPDALAFFEKEVRPILDKRCVRCHGGEKTKGKLSLVSREAMLKGGVSGDVIDWQDHVESLFLVAINYTDVDYEMPPTGKLPEEEIETLTRWVAAGLPWTPGKAGLLVDPDEAGEHGPPSIEEGKDYWAYKPIVKPEVPQIDDAAWAEHPIDALIYDKLKANGLEPNVEADRIALIRRASYNLTGLPPTPQEVQDFVNDEQPGAWERVIDRLLASKHYGEHWARHWMDIARYAETNGYERDGKKRNIWRYRDYLIRAFNSDTPYDRFIKEHVAGDLLPDRDAQSYIATGFNRLQIWDDEPTDRVQARADYISDIVDTTTNAFLATTLACAKCHDHKKDPITQSDYFAFYAFYNNIQEQVRGRDDAISLNLRDPLGSEKQRKAEAWDKRVVELRASIHQTESAFARAVGSQFQDKKGKLTPIAPTSEKQHQAWRYQTKDPGRDWSVQQFDDRAWPEAKGGFGYGLKRPNLPNAWNSDNIYLRRTFRLTEGPQHLTLSITSKDATEVYINGIRVYQRKAATGPRYQQVQLPAEALNALVVGSNSLAVKSNKGTDGLWFVDVGLFAGVVDPLIAKRAVIDAKGEELLGKEKLHQYKVKRSELDKLLAAPVARPYPAMVLNERDRSLPKQQIHERGSANALGEEVPARFPLVLGGAAPDITELPAGMNANGRRLALADWLASPDNPLTARVMVNRIWQHQFGRGVVRTSSDFGRLGELPTHPELLDYLAATFIEQGWSIKELNKFIMTSKAYQMSSSAQKAGLEKDPTNNLFWRFDMRRMTAEEFRDSLLAVNGSLNPKQFGPSIYTKMPKEVLATASRPGSAWGTSSEAERDRRSVYIHIKRSLREPLLAALDQAETDTPCPVRFATTVPTQSLITLNSEVMQDEAIVFAERLQKEAGPELADQVRLGLKLVLTREPTDEEVESNVVFVQDVMKEHGLDADRALKLFCLVAYNLNEFVYLD